MNVVKRPVGCKLCACVVHALPTGYGANGDVFLWLGKLDLPLLKKLCVLLCMPHNVPE